MQLDQKKKKREKTNYNIFVKTMVFLEKLGKYKIIRIEDFRKVASYKITTEKLVFSTSY